jgi:hypothetical protein
MLGQVRPGSSVYFSFVQVMAGCVTLMQVR